MRFLIALFFVGMSCGVVPLKALDFQNTSDMAQKKINAQIAIPLSIPVPQDAGGGYTHEQHKKNAKLIYESAMLFKLTGQKKYADFSIKILEAYANVYPNWGAHPKPKEQSAGRMFWQNLNESWWLVYVAQGYGAVKSELTDVQSDHIEKNLLRNMADFLSEGSPETFDRVHNHGTWATAAVGITGYIIGDQEYSEKALLGLDKSGQSGFLKQLDTLFSPDGYYNEGPYYQRYALMPFVLFGQAIEANEPNRKIFTYRDNILQKAIYATIELSYNGLFFPINDALKDKGIATTELLYGVAIAYDLTKDPTLLSIAQAQGKLVLTEEGRALSQAIKAGKSKPFPFRSRRFTDGADGTQGALDVLRASAAPDGLTVVVKNTSQGLGHGHFDKMGLLLFDQGKEILRDYGAARFLNIEAKYGGHYLPENNAYAKQTISHNALVVDEKSHFDGSTKKGNNFAPKPHLFSSGEKVQIASAQIDTAYEGVKMRRTIAMIKDKAFPSPVIIDFLQAKSDDQHQYDLPFHYNGHLIETNFDVTADPLSRKPLGQKNGYQYLWQIAQAPTVDGLSQVTFLLDKKFYTISSRTSKMTEVIFVATGANDPNFNLRHEPAFILRARQKGGADFVSVIEPHGEYNPTAEFTLNSHSHIVDVTYHDEGEETLIIIETKSGEFVGLALSEDTRTDTPHKISLNDNTDINWTGPYHLFRPSHLSLQGDK